MAGQLSRLDVLLVEDNPGDARLIEHYLDSPNVEQFVDASVAHATTLSDGRERLAGGSYDVVLLDLGLPESSGLDTLDSVLADDPAAPVIVLTGFDDKSAAVDAIQRGAQDYLPKRDLGSDQLVRALRYAVERHKQEQELQRRTEQMEFFNSILRHDMLNGMNVIHGRASHLSEELDGEHQEFADSILEWSDNIIDLARKVGTILDTVTDDDAVDLRPVDLCDVVHEEANRIREMSGVEAIHVDVPSSVRVTANELLSDIVGNLLTNAVEHSPEAVTITVEAERSGDDVFLTVADDGPGIDPEREETVFHRGEKGPESSGTGFGLFFVDSMIESYGGNVSVERSDEGGTSIVVELAAARVE